MSTPDLTEDEMVEILKEIARDGRNGAARIAAIKTLREIQAGSLPVAADVASIYAAGVRTKRVG